LKMYEHSLSRSTGGDSRIKDFTRFDALAKEALPNATPLTPEERVFINEVFGPTSNEPGRCESEKGRKWGLDGMIETIYHLSIIGRQSWHGL